MIRQTAVFVGIGGNIRGEQSILSALECLSRKFGQVSASPFYRTAALGPDGQIDHRHPDYVNGAAGFKTSMTLMELKQWIRTDLEEPLGRQRRKPDESAWADRTIDVDILLFGDLENPAEKVPHPDLYKRSFVAWSLRECGGPERLPGGDSLTRICTEMGRENMILLKEYSQEIQKMLNT